MNKSVDANSEFESHIKGTYPTETAWNNWIREHLSLVLGYFPSGHKWVGSGVPVVAYQDIATEGYSPLNETQRHRYVANVLKAEAEGAAGAFMDDINWNLGFRDGGESKSSLEPEEREIASLIEEVHKATPLAPLVINSQWHDLRSVYLSDPQVKRGIENATIVTKEFGVGSSSGVSTASDYKALLTFWRYLHEHGKHFRTATAVASNNTEAEKEYGLATYLLASNGGDYIYDPHGWPGQLWSGLEVNLGEALGEATRSSSGLWSRAFTHGHAYVVEPQGQAQSVAGHLLQERQGLVTIG